ncbi:response regulator [Nitratireductor sp. GISD-1A_MAKvit]|uniref:response regulator n=1 Tax=Nitratireductor sp. GISD-1A_MAKvit TaxID=3234198 RepID=UPI0034655B62
MKKTLDGARVLLVEDEALIAMSIEELCREHGAEDVTTVSTFEELDPQVLETRRISSAILDIRISENWTDAFARLLQSRRIPFVFATGYASNHHIFEGFSDIPVVEKPYKDSDLIEALTRAMTASSSQRPESAPQQEHARGGGSFDHQDQER